MVNCWPNHLRDVYCFDVKMYVEIVDVHLICYKVCIIFTTLGLFILHHQSTQAEHNYRFFVLRT